MIIIQVTNKVLRVSCSPKEILLDTGTFSKPTSFLKDRSLIIGCQFHSSQFFCQILTFIYPF